MSITDELREWAHGFNGPWRRNEEMLLAIADRIDAEHERAVMSAMNDYERGVEQASAIYEGVIRGYKAENVKMRETLGILWFCQQFTTDCDDCKLNDGDGKILEPCTQWECDGLCDRMRELGVVE